MCSCVCGSPVLVVDLALAVAICIKNMSNHLFIHVIWTYNYIFYRITLIN